MLWSSGGNLPNYATVPLREEAPEFGGHTAGVDGFDPLLRDPHDYRLGLRWGHRIYIPAGRMPKYFLPIAGDGCGIQFCLSLAGADRGYVYLWDHELEEGPEMQPYYGNTALAAKSFQEFMESIYCEEELCDEKIPAFRYAALGKVEELKGLCDKGLDVNLRDLNPPEYEFRKGWTLLMCACSARQIHVVRLLLEAGADVHARDDRGWTALFHALGCEDISALLLAYGAGLHATNNEGEGLLQIAITRNGPETVEFLVKHGADVMRRTKDGRTPLDLTRDIESKEQRRMKRRILRAAGAKS